MEPSVQRYNYTTGTQSEMPEVAVFLAEIAEVCRKHGFSIAHEDSGGAFLIRKYNDDDRERLFEACFES